MKPVKVATIFKKYILFTDVSPNPWQDSSSQECKWKECAAEEISLYPNGGPNNVTLSKAHAKIHTLHTPVIYTGCKIKLIWYL